ncbi:MAG: tetratricopeptide repeat protein [Bacteroidales bacterium]
MHRKLEKAESIYKNNPDSAYSILKKSINPRELSGDNLVKWCYLSSVLADSLHKKLPSDTLLLQAKRNIPKGENSDIAVYIDYYAGRALSGQKENKEALSLYLEALKGAEERNMLNLAGYICSYMADLFIAEFDGGQALVFYSKAEKYFESVGNKRSQTIAIRDIAKSYSYDKNFEKALVYALKADSMAQTINEPLLHGSITGYLGRFYSKLGQYDEAEYHIRKSIRMAPQYAYQSHFVLVDILMAQKELGKAKLLLDSLSQDMVSQKQKMVLYKYQYQVEKYLNNHVKSLEYLEKESLLADSLRASSQAKTLYEIEQKYAQEQLINANNKLKIKYQEVVIVVIGLILLLLIIFFFFRNKEHKREQNELHLKQELIEKEKESEIHKARLREQELISKNNEMTLRVREQELKDAGKRFAMMKDTLFQRSILYEKIKLISNLPVKNDQKRKSYDTAVKDVFGDPALSDIDWSNLKRITDELYPGFTLKLQEKVPSLSKDEVNFCCLLRFDLTSDKLALLLNITPNTIKSKRYRIMQKAGVTNQNIRLEDFLDTIG